ncbi:LuxR C-terminal-related transcriptional regulator [Kutzneria sp. 744]|uniref:LuxR C-terminal-related transcriptional regulator n=1 Tax=Kutzneria sp. (strain 744) TaxID=345341 RepID=UPI0004B627B3|nr:LuxR C-terminal-related transcriptional regulator [Kutzneria sp. 744]
MTSADSVDPPRVGGLPASLTTFIGRERELAEAGALLADPAARLITLHGPAGSGKTRLAEELARRVRDRFGQGLALIDLTQLEHRERLARFIGESLPRPLHDQSAEPGLRGLIRHLADLAHDQALLLVLDNCEHLVHPIAELVVAVLRAVDNITIIATSQELLGVPGERKMAVPPLAVAPARGDIASDDPVPLTDADGGEWEAVQLLADRIRDIQPDFVVTDANRAGLVRLCRAVDGLPLAIELAARWLRVLSAEQLLERLDLLDQTPGTGVGRRDTHRSLEAMVEATWSLCTPAQRALWARLWVFVGPFDLEAAQAVGACEQVPAMDVVTVLEELDVRSIIVAVPGETPRFRLLETFRREGRRRAAYENGLVDAVRRGHALHYHQGITRTAEWYYTAREEEGMRWFGTHMPNIRAALSACCEMPGLEHVGLTMAIGLGGYLAWWFHGSLNEGLVWLARTCAVNPNPSPARATALAQQGFYASCQGDHDQAKLLLDQARLVLAECDPFDPATTYAAAALAGIDGAHRWLSGNPDSVELLLRAADAMDALGQRGRRYFMRNLAIFAGATYSSDAEQMLTLADWLLADSAEAGYPAWNHSWALATAGLTQLRHGDPVLAVNLLRDGLRQQLDLGDQWGPGLVAMELAEALAVLGKHDVAATMLNAALVLVERSGMGLSSMIPLARGAERAGEMVRRALGEDALARPTRGGRAEAEGTLAELVNQRLLAERPDTAAAPTTPALTKRELDVAALVAQGLTYRQIGERLVISRRTAENHAANAMSKIEANDREQLAAWFRQHHGES